VEHQKKSGAGSKNSGAGAGKNSGAVKGTRNTSTKRTTRTITGLVLGASRAFWKHLTGF